MGFEGQTTTPNRANGYVGCTISVFCGDGCFSTYHHDLGKVVDHAGLNNKTHIEQNRSLDLASIHYLPWPTDPDLFRPVKVEKSYDLLFIGNNNSQSRFALLYKIHQRFDHSVAGPDWEGTGLNSLTEAYGSDFFSRLVGQARILLGLMSDEWGKLEACFSNRAVNTLACGGFLIQRYTPGLEALFRNHEHLVWYSTEEELFSLIGYCLDKPTERERIGNQGRDLVISGFTYDRAVARILEDLGRISKKHRKITFFHLPPGR